MDHEQWIKLTSEEKNIKVAELCGFSGIRNVHIFGNVNHPTLMGSVYKTTNSVGMRLFDKKEVPDYLNDLNAMHEAEKLLVEYGKRALYINYVYGIICRDENGRLFEDTGITPTDTLIFANADQKAEAFVLVLTMEE